LQTSLIEMRPFRRSDREQLTQLVNTHAAAVVPGMSVSVSTVVSALERQPGEFGLLLGYAWLDGTNADGPDYPDCRAFCRRPDSRTRPRRARMGADYAARLTGQPWLGRSVAG